MKTYIQLILCNLLLAVQTHAQTSCSSCCEPGTVGLPGPDGIPGVEGPGGIPGRPGKHGMHGYSGEKGDRGLVGELGASGIKGSKGYLGPPGPDGVWHGDNGEAGDIGNTGWEGPSGNSGDMGNKGHNGRTGDDGPPGHPRALNPSSFYAIFDGAGVWASTDNFVVPFNLVMENEGNDYSRHYGKYTAPSNGTYFFSTTVYKRIPQLQVSIQIFEYTTKVQRVIAYLKMDSEELEDSSTLHALMHLVRGDQVFITISREQALLTDTRRQTSFMGYLLMDDY